MKKKWFIASNGFICNSIRIHILPYSILWYTKHYFLETGVSSPAFGFKIGWLKYSYTLIIQQGY